MHRFFKIKDGLPWGWVKLGEDDSMPHIMDLSDADKAKTDAQKRALYAARILEQDGTVLDPDQDINVVQAKIDAWISDQSTENSDQILLEIASLLRDKGIL